MVYLANSIRSYNENEWGALFVYNATSCFSLILCTFAATLFSIAAYPQNMNKIFLECLFVDVNEMTFTQKYFTGNVLLMGAWLITLSVLLAFFAPVYAFFSDSINFIELLGALWIGALVIFACLPW